MILLDTNIFVIDRFFPRDDRFEQNRHFVTVIPQLRCGFSISSLLELCGISSFNLSTQESRRWMYSFEEAYPVEILPPLAMKEASAASWLSSFFTSLFERIEHKVTLGDAFVLQTAEEYRVDALVTWNPKDFTDRTTLPVLTPAEFLVQRENTP